MSSARCVSLPRARAATLGVLRGEVDRGLRTRRFLGDRESIEWARAARPIVAELEAAVRIAPSGELVELLQRAVGLVVKLIGRRADDSSGLIGALARELLALHARACDAGVADPVKLRWMVRFRFTDQDFFEVDPVRYAAALGDAGLVAYRDAVAEQEHEDSFVARHARERLAVLDGNTDAIVELHGGDLSSSCQFVRVAGARAELGRDDEVLEWTARGIEQTGGWRTVKLYDFACAVYAERCSPSRCLACAAPSTSRPTGKSSELWVSRLLGQESYSAGALARRRESGDLQAPS